MPPNSLIKVICEAGVASRRRCEEMVASKRVRVNNKVVTDLSFIVQEGDEVSVDRYIIEREEKRYFALHKPKGVVSTTKPMNGKRIISEFFKKYKERLFYAGRLDADSRGLMIITNDGTFANIITHPSFEVMKVYDVAVAGKIDSVKVLEASKGIKIKNVFYSPFKFRVLSKGRQRSVLRLTINEGKNREIRNIFEYLGYPVLDLFRISIGCVGIDSAEKGTIEEGTFRALSENEIEYFYEKRRKNPPKTKLQNAETMFFEKPKKPKSKKTK